MERKTKLIFVGILIGIVAFPTFALGGTFVSSLIQGKTVEEAIQVLAGQIDLLLGKVEVLETKQKVQEQNTQEIQTALEKEISQQKAYDAFRRAYDKVWLRGKTEGSTIQDTRGYCQSAIKEGRTDSPFCPLADELEKTWETYQKLLLEK